MRHRSSSIGPRLVGQALALLLAALTCACSGYSTKRLTDFPGARTIAVLPIENLGYYRDLDLRLAQHVAEEIRARTNLALATADTADLILTGRMSVREVPIVLDKEGAPIQKRLEGWLDVVVTERATGRVVRHQRVATTAEWRFDVTGESLDGSASNEWTRRLAEQVAQVLERPF
ncbi:MAG: LPS assembly lipoprotein LptE [Planctomycetota bacterium]|nr:LPS assembly lipoprotein LptE [Planctomycetota bacterium]